MSKAVLGLPGASMLGHLRACRLEWLCSAAVQALPQLITAPSQWQQLVAATLPAAGAGLSSMSWQRQRHSTTRGDAGGNGTSSSSSSSSSRQHRVLDMRQPARFFPTARAMQRRLVAHVGPTNSGKTHAALAALAAARSGVYAGPLRLLACEVADRLNAAGVPCHLVTGQEVRLVPGARHTACTVEMADLEQHVEVAVLDEAQMLSDRSRGWSWTRVLLGCPAQQLHLCGDPAAAPLLQQLAEQCGEQLTVHSYKRLSPLVVQAEALPGLGAVQEGDCVVAFGRKALHVLQRNIMAADATGRLQGVGLVHGGLPPEARRSQAALFNAAAGSRQRYSVLTASDAIGMGLNLNIRRVVFAALHKYDGSEVRPLTPSEVKQIAGRAGRFNSGHSEGYVSVLNEADLPLLRAALATATPALEQACLMPSYEQLEQFALVQGVVPGSTRRLRRPLAFHQLLTRFARAARLSPSYFMADMSNPIRLAKLLRQHEPCLHLEEMYTWCCSPASADDSAVLQALLVFASQYVSERRVTPDAILQQPPSQPPRSPSEMKAAEELFRVYELWLWLAGRVGHGVFRGAQQVLQQRQHVTQMIDLALRRLGGAEGGAEASSVHQQWEAGPEQPEPQQPSRRQRSLQGEWLCAGTSSSSNNSNNRSDDEELMDSVG